VHQQNPTYGRDKLAHEARKLASVVQRRRLTCATTAPRFPVGRGSPAHVFSSV
jgi:hypothetical protein